LSVVEPSPGVLELGVIDSHCHLQALEPVEREAALDAARERGVRGFLVPATRLSEADDILSLCHRNDDVWCALGVHPHEAGEWQRGDEARLAALLADPKAVAVGECGLDFFYDHSPRDAQDLALRAQWEIAIDLDLPVVVHNRESDAAMLDVVRDPRFAKLRGDFHSFAGSEEMARELVERGFSIGVSGMITFPRADNVRGILRLVPADRTLVETDTPFLAPVPYRGRPNRPAYVVEVLRRLAQERQISPDALGAETSKNFFRLFSKAQPPAQVSRQG
jgi:TatD DNase family protein